MWFADQIWNRLNEINAAEADAAHMVDKYGAEAPILCRSAIDSTSDPEVRVKLQMILRVLNAKYRTFGGKPVLKRRPKRFLGPAH